LEKKRGKAKNVLMKKKEEEEEEEKAYFGFDEYPFEACARLGQYCN